MREALYQEAIVAAARAAVGAGRITDPDASASVDNPLCGDRVTMDVRMRGDRIGAIGHVVRGCLLCEAAASIIAEQAPGRPPAEVRAQSDAVGAMLAQGRALPDGAWEALRAFTPVRGYKSRHRCVLLPFEAAIDALDRIGPRA